MKITVTPGDKPADKTETNATTTANADSTN
jgi:hypothetical protein